MSDDLNKKFHKVTGLTWNLEEAIQNLKSSGMSDEAIAKKILWLIPDGSMLDLEGCRQFLTKELLSDETLAELGIKESDKIGSDESEPEPSGPKCLTFTAGEGGASVGFIVLNYGYDIPEGYTKPSLQYSTDDGRTWKDYDLQISNNAADAMPIKLTEGASVMFKGVNENLAYYLENDDIWLNVKAYINGSVAASGDVTSLLNGVGGDVAAPQYCYSVMFDGCVGLTQAPILPATMLADYCYDNMFNGCTGLTQTPILPAATLADYCYNYMFGGCTGLTMAPELPATTLAVGCYSGMFYRCTGLTTAPELPVTTLVGECYTIMFSDCTSLTTAPNLPATTLADGCYDSMFDGCTSLTTAPNLPATTLADGCYSSMFSGCTSLTTAPELQATTLAEYCYANMFARCTSLTTAPNLPATMLDDGCYSNMFNGCTAISSHDVMTLNESDNVFYDNTGCTSFIILAETPPTIGQDTLTGLKADCIIYVHPASVNAYKTADYWSERADYIRALGSSD